MADCSKLDLDCPLQSVEQSLIPGLPDDIALACLARVPRKYNPVLNCVSTRWRGLVASEAFCLYRQSHHLQETWIYCLCSDKSDQHRIYALDPDQFRRGWKKIPSIPASFLRRKGVGFEVLGRKIYLFGGDSWREDDTDEVYSYDASMNRWTRAASLPTPRSYFACEALHGKIYAIGGLGSELSNMRSWDTYNSHTNSWTSHVDPNITPEACDSLVMDGKIYIRSPQSVIASEEDVVVFDPSSTTWQPDGNMNCWCGPAVVVDSVLYVLDRNPGVRLMMWEKDRKARLGLVRFSDHVLRPPCRLVAVGKKIFVVGRGLSTVVFDVESASCGNGVVVCSSLVKLGCDDEVLSCKSLAILVCYPLMKFLYIE